MKLYEVTHPTQVGKSIIYLLLTAAAIFLQAKGILDVYVIIAMVIAVLGVIPVYFVIGTVGKTITGFGLALGQGLLIVIGQSATLGTIEAVPPVVWIGLLVSAFAAIGIAIVPNTPLDAGACLWRENSRLMNPEYEVPVDPMDELQCEACQ